VERYGFDRHVWDVEKQNYPIERKIVMAVYALFTVASGLVKMSVLLFYRRLSSRSISPIFKWVLRIMIVVVGGYTIAFVLVLLFTCSPIEAYWLQVDFRYYLQDTYHFTCLNEGADVVANGIVATVLDLIVAFLPTLLCWKLQMPIRQKFALYGIFAISYSTVAIGCLRSYSTYKIYFETYDVTWIAGDSFLYAVLELHIGAMCANAPALKVFFKQLMTSERVTKLIGSSKSSKSSKQRSNGSSQHHINSCSVPIGISRTSRWVPVGFFKSLTSRTKSDGYISENNRNVSTDKHGGIVSTYTSSPGHSHSDSMTKPFAPEYSDMVVSPYDNAQEHDVEMGIIRSQRNSEISALPPLHSKPLPAPPSPRWLRPIRAISPFPKM
jgi:hypothetical protein